jgi:hypothetical protein
LVDGLLVHYPFNGDARDHSGQGNHGTANGTSPTANRYGHVKEALAFDRDYVLTTDLSKVLTDQLTVTGWLYRNEGSSGVDQVFEALTNVWELFLETKGSDERLHLHHSGDQRLNVYSKTIPNGRWFHFATVISSTEQSIYIDGKLINSVPHKGKLQVRTAFRIGRDYESKIQYWNGSMDDFRIYGRALDAKEIIALRDLEDDMVNLSAGLIAHYPYSGNGKDHSGNGNHGTVKGATLAKDRFGMSDSAYAFDGRDDHVFADVKNWTGDYTLSLWAKAGKTAQNRYCSVINGYDKTPGSPKTCQIHTSGGLFPTYQFFSSNAESFATVRLDWQHLAVTVNKRLARFYENGRQVYAQELEGGDANQFSNLIMGRNRHGNRHFEGLIDDVYVYDRALNPAEVARLHDGGLEDSDGDGLTDDYEVGHGRYAAIKGGFDWAGAKQDAKNRGGHIATITSEAEWKAVKQVLGTIPHGYYLGGTDEKTEGVWEWITGEAWKFTKWAPREPNNLWRSQYGDEDHVQTWTATSDGNRLWNDIYSKKNPWSKGYILEYGYYTDPTKADSDRDGADDGVEVAAGTDPNNPLSRPAPGDEAPDSSPGEAPVLFQEKIDQLEKEVVDLRNKVMQRDASIVTLTEKLKTCEAHGEKMKATIASRDKRVAELEKALQAAKTQIVALEERVDDRDTRIAYLESEVVQRVHSQQEAEKKVEELTEIAAVPFVNGWAYLPEQGWLWTDATVYPYVYRSDSNSWCYYQQGTLPRLFFDDSSKQWEAWDVYEDEVEVEVASK